MEEVGEVVCSGEVGEVSVFGEGGGSEYVFRGGGEAVCSEEVGEKAMFWRRLRGGGGVLKKVGKQCHSTAFNWSTLFRFVTLVHALLGFCN